MMNTEAMHTPGPWGFQYTDESGECFVIAKNLGGMVGAALPWPSEIEARDFRRVVANARLIAAAPDLLAGLEGARKALDRCEHDGGFDREIGPIGCMLGDKCVCAGVYTILSDAIAKATASPTGEAE